LIKTSIHRIAIDADISFCLPEDCPGRGCEEAGGINTDNIRIDPAVITDEIRKLLQE
jgi:hypothetical protein